MPPALTRCVPFSALADGDTIAVPNDTTNEARALLLLQDNGIITLKDGAGLEATVNDIAENPHNVKIEELAAEQVARVAPEVAFVVLNGNYHSAMFSIDLSIKPKNFLSQLVLKRNNCSIISIVDEFLDVIRF